MGSSALPSKPFQIIVLASVMKLASFAVERGPISSLCPSESSSKSSAT